MRIFLLPRLALLAGTFLALASISRADIVVLKSGEKIEGKITADSEKELTIEYKVSAGISDTRTILKAEVDKVEKESPEEITYQKLKAIKPGPTAFPAATYEQILNALESFQTQFPKSAHKDEIAQQITAFKEEKDRVDAGELKIGGKWLAKAEAERERYQLSGQVLLGQMQDQARRRDYVGALNTFEQLEKSYPGSYAYPDAVDLAKQILPALKGQADRSLEDWKRRKTERDQATQLASEPQKSQLLAAQKREQEQGDAAVEAVTKGRAAKWPPFLPNNEKSLSAIATLANTEQRRLENVQTGKMRESIQFSEKARGLIEENPAGAKEAQQEAAKLWSANEVSVRLGKQLMAVANPPKATPAPGASPTPTTTGATPSPAGKTVTTTAPGATPPAAEAPKAAEGSSLLSKIKYPVGLVVLLLLGMAGWNLYQKRQNKDDEHIGS